jgi:hypothetical protein
MTVGVADDRGATDPGASVAPAPLSAKVKRATMMNRTRETIFLRGSDLYGASCQMSVGTGRAADPGRSDWRAGARDESHVQRCCRPALSDSTPAVVILSR